MLYKVNNYILFNEVRQGKIHRVGSLKERGGLDKTICGLTSRRAPGKLIEGEDKGITCKTCQTKLANPVKWYCWGYDELPEWSGYVGGKKRYRVCCREWFVIGRPCEGGGCDDDYEGKQCCEEHYRRTRGGSL
jgi:hypothetical protein